jgi:hypothetical protein
MSALEKCQPYAELPKDKYNEWKTLNSLSLHGPSPAGDGSFQSQPSGPVSNLLAGLLARKPLGIVFNEHTDADGARISTCLQARA